MQYSRSDAFPPRNTHHRYAVQPAADGWSLTRDGRSIADFSSQAEALSVADKITRDLARAGIDVELAAPEGVRW